MTAPRARPAGRLGLGALLTAIGACAVDAGPSAPRCEAGPRLAIIAQSVPEAAYVPCVRELPTGWTVELVDVDDEGARIVLDSDRADRRVEVELVASCDVDDASPLEPREAAARTYQLVESIDPRYAGSFIDVFSGGCVVTTYDFARGAHVALVDEMQRTVGLYPRRQLAQELEAELDLTLDP